MVLHSESDGAVGLKPALVPVAPDSLRTALLSESGVVPSTLGGSQGA